MPTTIGTLAAILGCVIDTTAAFAPGAAAPPLLHAVRPARTPASPLLSEEGGGPFAALSGLGEKVGGLGKQAGEMGGKVMGMFGGSDSTDADKAEESDDDKMTLDKVASFGIAGILSIAVAETVFWVLSFPISEVLYYVSTGEWINLLEQVRAHVGGAWSLACGGRCVAGAPSCDPGPCDPQRRALPPYRGASCLPLRMRAAARGLRRNERGVSVCRRASSNSSPSPQDGAPSEESSPSTAQCSPPPP